MFSYEQAEEDIYQRLYPFNSVGVEVRKLPEDQSEFSRPFQKARITIGYKGSKWEKTRSTAHVVQEEKLIFEIAMQARSLRGNRGVYLLKRIVTQALLGFKPTDCDVMTADESGMVGVTETLKDGVWTYSAMFCCTTLSVEDFEEDLSIILKKITTNNPELGDSVVVEPAE